MSEDNNILCTRSYKHKPLSLNKGKEDVINNILHEYRRVASIILKKQIIHFYQTGKLSIKAKDFYGDIISMFSENYKDVIKRQIDGILKSYISNRKNEFKQYVNSSSLSDEIKKELNKINRINGWFETEHFLSRKIFKHIFIKKNNIPDVSKINMCLNTKVYRLEKNISTKSCSYHILLKISKIKNERMIISLKPNSYFDKIINDNNKRNLKINNSIQLNFNKNNKLTNIVLSTSHSKFDKNVDKFESKNDKIGLDFGIKNLLTSNKGDIFGKGFINKLTYYDNKIQKLQKELQRRKIKLSDNKRYNNLNRKLRSYIKNEINRVVNNIIKVYSPSKIILEDLDFQQKKPINQFISKRMNRLFRNCGISNLKLKFKSINEDKGIEIEYINPAYTSQECSKCHYVDKENRLTRDKFECLVCKQKLQADVNGARIIVGRSNDKWFTENKYANSIKIKQHIMNKHNNHNMFSDCTLSCADVSL